MPARSAVLRFCRLAPVVFLAGPACDEMRTASATAADGPAATVAAAGSPFATARADAVLLAATKVALPPPGTTAADLPDPHSRGAVVLDELCSQCHELPAPTMHSATDWPRVVRRMWLRMDRLPDSLGIRTGSEGDRSMLLDYLSANALQVSGGDLPHGRGRDDFALVCSRCHALPDIRLHTNGDWPAVFMRMERNMERMNVAPPTPEQTTNILLYLQEVATAQ